MIEKLEKLGESVDKLEGLVQIPDPKLKFQVVLQEIAQFYVSNFHVQPYEVAIFFCNKDKSFLKFVYPDYMVDSGMIPVNSDEALAALLFQEGRTLKENNLQSQKHLAVFQSIKVPNEGILPIWKMIGSLLSYEEEKLGVIEISRRGVERVDAGPDFTDEDLQFLQATVKKFGPFIKAINENNL